PPPPTPLHTLSLHDALPISAAPPNLPAQDPSMGSSAGAAPVTQAAANSAAPAPNTGQVAVPTGTRLPLLLRNGINTRTAKAGDSDRKSTRLNSSHVEISYAV